MLSGLLRTLVVLAVVVCFIPLSDAQGGQGNRNPPIAFTFTKPASAVAKNHSLDLTDAGAGEAVFDVTYRQTSGGMMGGGMGGFCSPGTKVEITIDVSPATGVVLDKKVATFDVGTSAPSVPPTGGNAPKVSKDHKLTFALDVKNATSGQVIVYNITAKSLAVTGGNCAPANPTLPANAGKAYLNVTFPVKKFVAAVKQLPKKDAPSPEFLGIALASLVGFALRRRREVA